MIEFLIFGTCVLILCLAIAGILDHRREHRSLSTDVRNLEKTIVDRTKIAPVKEEAIWGPALSRHMMDDGKKPTVKFKDDAEEAQLYHNKKTFQ